VTIARSLPSLREHLAEEPFTLALSSGFFGFFAHAGLVSALDEAGLVPAALTGSSAGALVAGAWASGRSGDDLATHLLRLRRADFWDPAPGLGLLRGGRFQSLLEETLLAPTFAECRAPLSVSVYDVAARKTVVLSAGPLASAIRASCTFPGLFQPTWHEGRAYLDGGIADRPGLLGAPPGRVLFHHLASRSPWRKAGASSLAIPERAGLVALVLGRLPRLGPFRLEDGIHAYTLARARARRALDEPVASTIGSG
jgi:NTE family protein